MAEPLRFAVVGAGGFARFAVAQFVRHPGAQLVGVYDRNAAAVQALQQDHPAARAHESLAALLADPAVDLVYIGSPPFLHHAQSLAALRAGKHVICEKPAALSAAQARELRALAAEHGLLFVVNLMQRYNPLYGAVKALIEARVLGEFLHGFFENYASDEFLAPDHWFWDQAQSGGIFIEHGVHFFDMFAGWLGPGRVVAAQKLARPGHAPPIWDLVQCSALYANKAPVQYYHAFNQPKILDRQEMRLQFERGELTLFEWVPTRLVLNAICTHEEVAQLQALFPGAQLQVVEAFDTRQIAQGRFKPLPFDQKVRLEAGGTQTKSQVYEGLVSRMFADQLAWLAERSRTRQIDADNAVDSVATAEQAEQMALCLS